MKKETKKQILKSEINNHIKRKKTTIKNKKVIEKTLNKVEGISILTSNFLISVKASLIKNISLTDKIRNIKRHLKSKKDILNCETLTQQEKQTLLIYNNMLDFKIKDINKDIKSELKSNILKVLQNNIKNDNTIESDSKKFYIDIEIKNNLNNLTNTILNLQNVNLSFNILKKAILSAYCNKLIRE